MATDVEIANIALARIGVRTAIGSFAEDSAEAKAANTVFTHVRDVMLTSYAWPFVTSRVALAVITGVTRAGWSYAFSLPDGISHIFGVWPNTRTPREEDKIPYAIEMNDAGTARILLADVKEPTILYVHSRPNTAVFSPLFVDALAWALARELALALPVKPQLGPLLDAKYDQALARAKVAAMREAQGDMPRESEFITVRD